MKEQEKIKQKQQNRLLRIHQKAVQSVLDQMDIPFVEVKTYWFKDGQINKGKQIRIRQDLDILISSYAEINGHTIRISNHHKKKGYPEGITNYIYDASGNIIEAANYPRRNHV